MKSLETDHAFFELIDGILVVTYKSGLEITFDIAREIVKSRLAFTEGKDYPTLICDMGMISMDKKARDYFSSGDGVKGVSAGALLADSEFKTLLANFFLRISKPKLPAKMFTNKSKAMEWLKSYR